MRIAIYPGSFDPITKGHLDVLKKAAIMFDKVIIVVMQNSAKKPFISIEDRINLIKESVNEIKNVEVDSFNGLTIEYAKQKNSKVIIRGLRAVTDFEYELQLSQTNAALAPDVNTVFLTTKPKYNFISSSVVKEISQMNGDIEKFVPECVSKYLHKKSS